MALQPSLDDLLPADLFTTPPPSSLEQNLLESWLSPDFLNGTSALMPFSTQRTRAYRPLPPDPTGWLIDTFPSYFQNSQGIPIPLAPHHEAFWRWVWALRAGEPASTFIAIWARGGGKCLAGDTQIQCADGSRVCIQDIQVGQPILSYNEETGRIESDVILKKWESGLRECVRVRTRTHKTLTLTPDHQVLTFDGWKKASELTIRDRIASPRRAPILPCVDRSDEAVRFLAYMIAEGGTSQKSARFTNADPVIVEDFIHCAQTLGFRVTQDRSALYGYRVSSTRQSLGPGKGLAISAVRQWVKDHNLQCLSIHKRLPAWVYGLPDQQKWMFLAALIDTDGWIYVARGRLAITLANERLIEDIAYLCMQLGLVTTWHYKPNSKNNAWELRIDQDGLRSCVQHMPLRLKNAKLVAACATPRYSLLDTYPNSVTRGLPHGMNRHLRNTFGARIGRGAFPRITRTTIRRLLALYPYEPWQRLEQADVFWDEVLSLEPVGLYETYDVEVANNHNMITNQLITHNSVSAEMACTGVGYYGLRRYGLYISNTQSQADDHVTTVGSLFGHIGVDRAVNKYGQSKGWRVNRLRTIDGFTLDAIGLDAAMRGSRLDESRPDFIVLDDLDDEQDTSATIQKKILTLTRKILPAGAPSMAALGVQNIPNKDGIFAQLSDGRAPFLLDRHVSGPHPALADLPEQDWWARELMPDGTPWLRILTGAPTWKGQGVAECEALLNKIGIPAFLVECQHRIDRLEGTMFKRNWFTIVKDWPRDGRAVRYWDFAATEAIDMADPDWTVGLKMVEKAGQFWIVNIQRDRLSPKGVEDLAKQTAQIDGTGVTIWLEQEPGSSGKRVVEDMQRRVLAGYRVYCDRVTGAKAERAKPFSSAAEAGNVFLVEGPWVEAFLEEIVPFPGKGKDDQVDGASGAHTALTSHGPLSISRL